MTEVVLRILHVLLSLVLSINELGNRLTGSESVTMVWVGKTRGVMFLWARTPKTGRMRDYCQMGPVHHALRIYIHELVHRSSP